jgi:hypothetical protein
MVPAEKASYARPIVETVRDDAFQAIYNLALFAILTSVSHSAPAFSFKVFLKIFPLAFFGICSITLVPPLNRLSFATRLLNHCGF